MCYNGRCNKRFNAWLHDVVGCNHTYLSEIMMTKREAKIEALRIATAMLNNPPIFYEEDELSEEYQRKIYEEISNIKDSIKKRAEKLGGDFNEFTGY